MMEEELFKDIIVNKPTPQGMKQVTCGEKNASNTILPHCQILSDGVQV